MNKTEASEVIKAYTENIIAAEPEASTDEVNVMVAAAFLKYVAAEVDPRKFPYYPHPYNEAESILHNAATHLVKEVA